MMKCEGHSLPTLLTVWMQWWYFTMAPCSRSGQRNSSVVLNNSLINCWVLELRADFFNMPIIWWKDSQMFMRNATNFCNKCSFFHANSFKMNWFNHLKWFLCSNPLKWNMIAISICYFTWGLVLLVFEDITEKVPLTNTYSGNFYNTLKKN